MELAAMNKSGVRRRREACRGTAALTQATEEAAHDDRFPQQTIILGSVGGDIAR